MSIVEFDLTSLSKLDNGKAALAFVKHLKRAALDCYDRPGDDKARKVQLEVLLAPILDTDGSCSEVKAQMKVSSATPKHSTKVYSFGVTPNGSLRFSEDSPTSFSQTTLMDDDDDET